MMDASPRRVRARSGRVIAIVALLATVIGGLFAAAPATALASSPIATVAGPSGPVLTADLTQFNPGNIISDAVFYNSGTMSEAQIQAFLDSKVRSCATGNTCLKDYYDTSRAVEANAMCAAYSGGWGERASTIIFRVAQACGINPQVILVMLEKEQSLVSHTNPSATRYRIAMGQGCPDTAACDTRYYGFFNQVMGAAWQLKRYANPPGTSQYFTWYPVGRVSNVLFNPNAACGSSPVLIQNRATAALYYYTPYQPNAAALRAGYGLGDGCSAYGNRNFYNFFNDWFGSTQRDVGGEISAEYRAQGGAAVLGAAITGLVTLNGNGGGYGTAYERGSIYWSFAFGAKTVLAGPLRDYYFARGGADGDLGWPALNQQTLALATGSGTGQLFSGGSLYSGVPGTFIVREPLRAGYFSQDGASGSLSWPVADQVCASGTCRQEFAGGTMVSSAAGSFPVVAPVRSGFDAAGGVSGAWGVPWSGPVAVPYHGGGFGQVFANGSVFYRSGGPVFFVTGVVRDAYFARGGAAGVLGFPAGALECADSSSCRQRFDNGWLLWTAAGGARVGAPAIDAAYAAAGGAGGALGARTGAFASYSFNGGGFAEGFANGVIFVKTSLGVAYPVSGKIRDAYFAAGGAGGAYGWPTSAMTCNATTCTQNFEGGPIAVAL